jgi:signal transduction histidine kinase
MSRYKSIPKGSETDFYIHNAKKEWERTVDSMPDSIAIIDVNYNILRLNKTMLDKMGFSSYLDAIGSKCYSCIGLKNEPPEYCPHTKLLQDQKEHKVEIYNERFGGHCEIQVIPYRDTSDNLLGSIHIIRDINLRVREQKDKEVLLSQRLQSQKLESVGQLASGIAHEINTPAQFIGSNVSFLQEACSDIFDLISEVYRFVETLDESSIKKELLSRFEKSDYQYLAEEVPSAIKQTNDGIGRITSIVKAMKEFSHPGSKSKEPTDLNHIIENIVTIARNEWKYVSQVKLNLYRELPEVPLLADEMGQVILNLLVNAAHAIAEKIGENPEGEKGIITISTLPLDNGVEVVITDTGVGIPEKIQNRIFDPFFTTKKIGSGTGQGLAIAHDVVTKKHNGRLAFTTMKSQGTEFTIWLPEIGS